MATDLYARGLSLHKPSLSPPKIKTKLWLDANTEPHSLKYYDSTTQEWTDIKSSGGAGEAGYPEVQTYNELPLAEENSGEIYVVLESSGIYLINRKERGLYYSNGVEWSRLGNFPEYFRDDNFEIYDNDDPTRACKFEVGNISINTTRTLTVQDKDGTIATLNDIIDYSPEINELELTNENQEINGIPTDQLSNFTVTYNQTTRVVTINRLLDWYYYVDGKKYNVTTDIEFDAHDTTYGLKYFYFNNLGQKVTSNTPFDLLHTAQIYTVLYNGNNVDAVKGLGSEELHGVNMSSKTHKYLHLFEGTRFHGGGAISNYLVQVDSLAGVQYSVDSAKISDEDIDIVADPLISGNYSVFWREGVNGEWNWNTNSNMPFLFSNNNIIQYNSFIEGVWGRTEISTNDRYINTYVLFTNIEDYGAIIISGQQIHGSLNEAKNASFANLELGVLPINEFVAVWKITFRYRGNYSINSKRARIEAIPDKINISNAVLSGISGNHNSLSGRSDANSHPSTAISYDNQTSGLVSENLKDAIDELEIKKQNNLVNDDITDDLIGNRTINDSVVVDSDTGKLNVLFNWIGNMIKSITGKTSWRIKPDITLEATKTHVDDANIHFTKEDITKEDVGLSNVDNTSDMNKPISTLTQSELNNKVDKITGKQLSTEDYTTEEKTKLANVEENANNYTFSENYEDLNNIPSEFTPKQHTHTESEITNLDKYTKQEVDNKLDTKVDKITGKGLSTNDYSNVDKTKLSGIAANANNYIHPSTHPASIIVQTSTHRFVTDTEKNNWNSKASLGQLSEYFANNGWTASDLDDLPLELKEKVINLFNSIEAKQGYGN